MDKNIIDIAYCFLHQKQQVYLHSRMDWQRDDIEMAVADYVRQMNKELYILLSADLPDFLLAHSRFEADLSHALQHLEQLQQVSEDLKKSTD